ncbi:hypothetical protein NM688_g747 [Phlebia brevispora]|uniref:Uncharacterized protein n=1 Tax=Phlebia brevispora TaxID=194682 RepID=A0ACC1TDU7_9APHY|nr:hypothetical protein NM688_g747 [Phlebia brevispora]
MVLLRFAPSPTGALHLGGLRTALYNYLYARKLGGKWILRIEDTDATRTVPGAVDGIRGALEWAGLEYDYGADYFSVLAKKVPMRLISRLAETRERLARTGSNDTYDKACLHLTDEEVARRVRAGEKYVVRLNDSNLPMRTSPKDLVFGVLKDAHASLPTDPVLLKSDMFPTYHLASVVDDHEMKITHVLRGEEWLPSLPLHLDLYACFGFQVPQFAHLPLLLNPDGTKMSKRKGDVQVFDYKRRGWEPSAVLNWLALAGWGAQTEPEAVPSTSKKLHKEPPDSTTVMTMEDMIREFDLSSITPRRTVMDPLKLEYLNKHHLMRELETENGLLKMAERAHDTVKTTFPLSQYTSVSYIKEVIRALEARITNLHDIPVLAPYFFTEGLEPEYCSDGASMLESLMLDPKTYVSILSGVMSKLETTEWDVQALHDTLENEREALGVKNKFYMMALRHALTGMKAGPPMATVMHVLGKDRTLLRLQMAHDYVASR